MSFLIIRMPKKRLLRVTVNSFFYFLGLFILYLVDDAMGWNRWLLGTVLGASIWMLFCFAHYALAYPAGKFLERNCRQAERVAEISVLASLVPTMIIFSVASSDAENGLLVTWLAILLISHAISLLMFSGVGTVVVWVNLLINEWEP